jgi:hypothetical protein
MATSKILTEDDFENIRYQSVDDTTYSSGVVVLANEYVESRRWFEVWELIWSENDGKDLFSYYYQEPATEYQEGSEDEFDPDLIREVVAEEVTVIKYTRVPKKKSKVTPNSHSADGSYIFPSGKQEYDLTEATSEVFRAYLGKLE